LTRVLIALFLALTAIAPALAQEDDRSRLVRFLEDTLSDGAARQVRIEGFAGALSSIATLERLTIADAGGVWLTVEGAELTWRRAGLLAGEVDITRLAAERIVLARLPMTEAAPATPEATPFALPDLPVSINIAALEADRIELGGPLLGFEVAASASGSLNLAGGQGSAAFDLIRRDGPEGVFALAASYANDTRQLEVDLDLSEDPGGIAVTVLGIADAPAVDLAITGSGPVDDFTSTIALATDGVPRVTGGVTLARTGSGDQRLEVDLAGDVARFLLPEYQPFFGYAVALTARAVRATDGAMMLEVFDLSTASLNISGSGALDPGGAPERFNLTATLRPEGATQVRLPVPGQVVAAASADLTLSYDRAAGDAWAGQADLRDLRVGDLSLDQAELALAGTIVAPDNALARVSGRVTAAFQGLALPDAALQVAVGSAGQATFSANWRAGAPLDIEALTLLAENARLRGTGQIAAAENTLILTTELLATVPDLAAFADLAGADLTGAVTAEVAGEVELLSGAFDLELGADAQDISLGMGEPAGLLAGETRLTARAVRDAEGLRLDAFEIAGTQVEANGNANLSSAASRLQITARLRDAALLSASLSGPLSAEANLARANAGQPWDLDAEARLQSGAALAATGQVGLPGGAVDLALSGTAALALINPFIAPRSVQGTADLNLRLAGPPGLSALNGTIEARDMRIAAPNAGLAIENASASVALAGGRADITGQGSLSSGGGVTLTGSLDLGAPGLPGRFDIGLDTARIAQGDLFQTVVERGDIRLFGPMTGGPAVSGQITLGQTDIVIEPTSFGTAEPIPEIRHIGENAAQYATRANAGLLAGPGASGPPLPLDLTITAANRIFLRGSGLDAELGGAIRIGGTSANVVPSGQFDLIRGRLSLLGQRFDLVEASVTLSGSFDPFLRVVGQTEAGDTQVFLTLSGPADAPELTLSSQPDLPEDEILSRLLFGRGTASLSPVQALQLVDGVSRLAGSGSIIGGIRDTLGIDDLDIRTDAAGNAELRLGRYIGENAYTDIGIGSDGEADLSLNLDLTPNLTARGSFGSDGEGGLGIFFERDY